MRPLPLAAHTFGSLHRSDLPATLAELAAAGFEQVELAAAPPHLHPPDCVPAERARLRRVLAANGLRACSLTPTFGDLNLASENPQIWELSVRQLRASLELAHDLDVTCVVTVPGRVHPLLPAPRESSLARLRAALERLLDRADALGVSIGLENAPYGLLRAADELAGAVDGIGHPRLGVVYDCANAIVSEDPAEGVRAVAGALLLAHVSDAAPAAWAHARIGRGTVDFAAFARALRESGFAGVSVYEVLEPGESPARLSADLPALRAWGWEPRAPAG